jgi:thiol-disulfide isomerase/thioredoxin
MRSSLLLLLFSSVLFSAVAGSVTISGHAPDYVGRKAAVVMPEDEFSGKRIVLGMSDVNDQGKFEIKLDLDHTARVFIRINRVEAAMYVQPGMSYEVIFPGDKTASIKRFDRTEVDLDFVNLPADDLNFLIREFNADVSDFIVNHYYDFAVDQYAHVDSWLNTRGDSRTKVDMFKPMNRVDSTQSTVQPEFNQYVVAFKKDVDLKYDATGIEFFDDYVEFSLAEIDVLSGMNRKSFYSKYFMSRVLPLENPAFARTFSLFYHDFLSSRKSEMQSRIVRLVNVEKNPDLLMGLFENDSTCLSPSVRTLAVIQSMKSLYHDKTYQRRAIEKLLLNVTSDDQRLVVIAKNTAGQLQKNREDYMLENFTCINENQDKWELSDHKGHYVYCLFFASWSPTSIKELQIMQKWHEKYGKAIEFVAICMDDDYDSFKKILTEHKDMKFDFLYGNADPLLTEKAMIYAIPEAIMLNEEGRTMYARTRKPSEGIQMDFEKIIAMYKQNGTGPKTWKD